MDEKPPFTIETPPPVTVVAKDSSLTVAPNTTEQEDMTLAGQRRINLIWEFTQAIIAIAVILGYVGLVAYGAVSGKDIKVPESMTNTLFLVVGFYFSRTNHAAVGGVGSKAMTKYVGR